MSQLVNSEHRERMERLESAIINSTETLTEDDFEYHHHFAHGVYVRELYAPAGVVLSGAVHKNSSVNMLTKGSVKVITDTGTYTMHSPATFVTDPGVKKGFLVLEDCVLVNAFPWDGVMTIDEIIADLSYPSYKEMELALGVDS